MKVTEEDVVRAYMPIILQKCKGTYTGLEFEDRLSEGYLALIYAMRTYKIDYGYFENYFNNQFRRIMKQQNAKAWVNRRQESRVSLNAPVSSHANKNYIFAAFIGRSITDDSEFDIHQFINTLSSDEQKIISMRMIGYSINRISLVLKISPYSVNRIITMIQTKYLNYYKLIICK